ncbi:unnamed protein product [Rotaria sordida]|uniref:Uncharacterized protein n=1 Tax=Rotaria sordida TaxID=392033 RepID=A0A815I5D8_9BILA|nr:unnamed protein product [Rotaria sordida]CAF1607793.1 unnamed protein product [Rotaria sordida]
MKMINGIVFHDKIVHGLLIHLQLHVTMASSKDQSLLDIYSTQLTNFIVVSLFELRLIDPFIVTFRALANRKNINRPFRLVWSIIGFIFYDSTIYLNLKFLWFHNISNFILAKQF